MPADLLTSPWHWQSFLLFSPPVMAARVSTPPSPVSESSTERSPFRFGLVLFALIWSSVLLFAGGFTTSIGAGMAFLDWPLSNGSLNPAGWMQDQDQLAEHSHRLAGMKMGFLALVIAGVFAWREKRRGVRLLAYALLVVVVVQGLLGGLRVLLDQLNTGAESNVVALNFAIAHAIGAQVVVLLLATLCVLCARGWWRGREQPGRPAFLSTGGVAFLLLSVAILVGAMTRHYGAGLAIPTFPAAEANGSWIPDGGGFAVWVHFTHRTLGILGGVLVLVYALQTLATPVAAPRVRAFAWTAVALVVLQVWLGILILQTFRNPHVATLHMLNGAALLACLWTSLCWRYREWPAAVAASSPSPQLSQQEQHAS